MDEVKQFQTYLSDYQINIVSKEHQNSILYSGREQEKRSYLYLHDNHYDVITSMPGFLARSMYCHTCKIANSNQGDHLCPNACKCGRFPNCPMVSWIHFDRCNRDFKSQECFDRHKHSVGKSICAQLVKCPDCNTVVRRSARKPEKHHCGKTKCRLCKEYTRTGNHRCYMQPVTKRNTTEDLLDNEPDEEDSYRTTSSPDKMTSFSLCILTTSGVCNNSCCATHVMRQNSSVYTLMSIL